MALAVVSGDGLLTSIHAARSVGMVGGPKNRRPAKGKKKGSVRARSALVLDFDGGKEGDSSSISSSAPALAWFLAPTPDKQQQQLAGTGRRKRMANYFPERIPALAAKYDLCAGGPALQAALTHGGGGGGGIGRRYACVGGLWMM